MEPIFRIIDAFLNRIGERQRHTFAIIHPNKDGLQGATFESPHQVTYMYTYIRNSQKAGYGVYYSLNEGIRISKQRGYNGKLLANEIVKCHMLGFDIDYITGDQTERNAFETRALELVLSGPKPSVIVSTGGGIQLLYILVAPLDVALSNAKIPTEQEAKADLIAQATRDDITTLYADIVLVVEHCLRDMISEKLIKVDKLSNIDRVFRLPGTVNFPTQVKIEKGATVRLAEIIYDEGYYWDFTELREAIPQVTKQIERKPKTEFVERAGTQWTAYKKAHFLCEYIKDNKLADENENYTWNLMFPLFGMINANLITAEEGRELWLLATSTGRETAYGNYEQKWDKRKVANYTSRDLGSLIYFCRQHDCLIPWSTKDLEKQIEAEAAAITLESMRNPAVVKDNDLLGWD